MGFGFLPRSGFVQQVIQVRSLRLLGKKDADQPLAENHEENVKYFPETNPREKPENKARRSLFMCILML